MTHPLYFPIIVISDFFNYSNAHINPDVTIHGNRLSNNDHEEVKIMKNHHLSQVIPLTTGLLIFFSGQALSLSFPPQELTNGNVLNNSNSLITQEKISVSVAVAVAVKVLDRAVTVVETQSRRVPVNVPSEYRDIILPKLRQAQRSMAIAESAVRKGDNYQVATAMSQAVGFMDEAQATSIADAGVVRAIAQAVVKANEAVGLAQASTKS